MKEIENAIENAHVTFSNSVTVVNATPHPLSFLSPEGEKIVIPTSVPEGAKTGPLVINARPVEKPVPGEEGLVTTEFIGNEEGKRIIGEIKAYAAENGLTKVRIVGSIIAAQAYPGLVVGMCPAPGFERVPPAQKLMTVEKFSVFM